MKRIGSILGVLLTFTTNSSAIESGTYRCQSAYGNIDVILKKSGRAQAGSTKGFWKDYDDEALVVNQNWILEDKGHGKYTFRGTVCTKITKENLIKEQQRKKEKEKKKQQEQQKKKQKQQRKKQEEQKKKQSETLKVFNLKNHPKGIFLDKESRLMWQDNKDSINVKKTWITDANYKAKDYMNISGDTASNYCKNLTLEGYEDWRIPTVEEIKNLREKHSQLKNIVLTFDYWAIDKEHRSYSPYFPTVCVGASRSYGADHIDGNKFAHVTCVRP